MYFIGVGTDNVREWLLRCGCIIICDENHRIGQRMYCSKCNAWTMIAKWRYYERSATSYD